MSRLNKEIRAKIVEAAEKLLEQWPEAKVLIPKEVEKANAPMPIALQTDTLNKLIGLPK